MKKQKKTSDALEIIDRRYFRAPDATREVRMTRYEEQMKIAEQIVALREQAGLTQEQLAKKVQTSRSTISRLEDADYRGHSMRMLERIAAALDARVEVRLAPILSFPQEVRYAKSKQESRVNE
jgi:DNA-binding XRE family transcriptional regulator